MFNRDAAITLKIIDPDSPQEQSRITDFININEDLFCVTETGIYRILTADTIDPEKNNSDTRHSYEKLYSIGSRNSLVVRTIIQFKEIFPHLGKSYDSELLIAHEWACAKYLFSCEDSLYCIYNEIIELTPTCDKIIEENKKLNTIPPLPKVKNLESHVTNFLINAKHLILETYKYLNLFFNMPIKNREEAHFNKHRAWIEENLGIKSPVFKILHNDENWIRIISECSNAIRHPEDGLEIEIQNFRLLSGNKACRPAWKYDLRKKGLGKYEEHVDLFQDLNTMMNNMLHFHEDIIAVSVQELLKDNPMLAIQRRNTSKETECTPLYVIGLKKNLK